MAEIGFYHLLTTPLDRALPRLLERARAQGYRIVVRAASPDRVEHLNSVLWTYDEASFLPHGSARDGNAANQPIWLTDGDDNPNAATMLVLVDGAEPGDLTLLFPLYRPVRRQRRSCCRGGARPLAPPQGRRPHADLLAADRRGLGEEG